MGTRVYKYGLLAPTDGAALVHEQMLAAHRYRNTLVEIERGRRAALRKLDREQEVLVPLRQVIDAAETELLAALASVKACRSASRSRSDTEGQRARVRLARVAKRDALAFWRQRRIDLRDDPETISARALIEDRAHELRTNARAHCQTYWGTYLLIEDADMAARKMPLYDGLEPSDPHFVRWQGDGHVGVQLQGGMSASEALSNNDTRFRIAPVDEKAWFSKVRGERRRMSRTFVKLRLGTGDGRSPIWGTWPMIMHRPIPEGGRIKRATVSLKHRGPREEWSIEITVDMPELVHTTCGKGAVALDVGWRVMTDEIRVGRWYAENGESGELRMPIAILGGFKKTEDLRSIRDKNFNAARNALKIAIAVLPEVPEWLQTATRTLSQWRALTKLAALAKRWKTNRFNGDKTAYDNLEAWRYHDYHLWSWETSQAIKTLRRRKNEYRVFAAQLATRFETLVMEKFDLRAVAKRPLPETPVTENETARYSRQISSVSELRLILAQAFTGRGGYSVAVPAENTTKICNHCGSIEHWDQAAELHHACDACGTVWDQDDNAARNLLVRWKEIERLRVAKTAGSSRNEQKDTESKDISENRWVRAKRMANEKTNRNEAARKSVDNSAE